MNQRLFNAWFHVLNSLKPLILNRSPLEHLNSGCLRSLIKKFYPNRHPHPKIPRAQHRHTPRLLQLNLELKKWNYKPIHFSPLDPKQQDPSFAIHFSSLPQQSKASKLFN